MTRREEAELERFRAERARMAARMERGLDRRMEAALYASVRRVAAALDASGSPPSREAEEERVRVEVRRLARGHIARTARAVWESEAERDPRISRRDAVDLMFGLPEAQKEFVSEHLAAREYVFVGVSKTNARWVYGKIAKDMEAGEGTEAIARGLRRAGRIRTRRQARLIARTETHGAMGAASHGWYAAAAAEFGEAYDKQWAAINDPRTRAHHALMNGARTPMDQPFQMPNGASMLFPGDFAGGAANTCNCRCSARYVPAEAGPEPEPWKDGQAPDGDPAPRDERSFQEAIKGLTPRQAAKAAAADLAARMRRSQARWKGHPGENDRWTRAGGRGRSAAGSLPPGWMNGTAFRTDAERLGFARLAHVMPDVDRWTDSMHALPIRGAVAIARNARAPARMTRAVGVLWVNPRYLGDPIGWYGKRKPSPWRAGDPAAGRPRVAGDHFDVEDPTAQIRYMMMHEASHTIHDGFGMRTGVDKAMHEAAKWRDGAPVASWLKSNWPALKKTAGSTYGDKNKNEWFAETGALFEAGKFDRLTPAALALFRWIRDNPDGREVKP